MTELNDRPFTIVLRQGTQVSLNSTTTFFSAGELAYTTDTKRVFISDGSTNNRTPVGRTALTTVSADVTSSSTTLANVTGLSATLYSSNTYSLESTLFFTDGIGAGVQAAVSTTSSGVFTVIYEGYLIDDASTFPLRGYTRASALGTAVASSLTTGTSGQINIKGTITTSGTAGPINIQFAQNTVSSTQSIVKAGSYMLVRQ